MQWIFGQFKFYRHLDLQTGLLYAWNNLDKSTRYLFHTGYFIFRSVQVLHVVLVLIYRNFTTMNRNLILVWPKLDVLYLWMIHLEEIGGYNFFQTSQLFSKKLNNCYSSFHLLAAAHRFFSKISCLHLCQKKESTTIKTSNDEGWSKVK